MTVLPSPLADRAAALRAALCAALLMALFIAGKTARDALFLSSHPSSDLPKVMFASALLSIATAIVMARYMSRVGPRRTTRGLCLLHALAFAAEWGLTLAGTQYAAILLYLHLGAFGALGISMFWSIINERFDPHAAKQHIARIAAGGALGGLLGGLAAERIAYWFDLPNLLAALTLLSLGCWLSLAGIDLPRLERSSQEHSPRFNLRQEPYLAHIALLVLFVSISGALVDYVLKAEAATAFRDPNTLTLFFGIFYSGLSLATFLVQSFVTTPLLRTLGLAGTIAILPGALLLTGGLGALVTRLATVSVMAGLDGCLRNSLFRSGYELLYTPVERVKKRAAKTVIDVAFDRVGDMLAAGLILAALAIAPALSSQGAIVLAIASSGASLWLARRIDVGYVGALASSLRNQTISLDATDVVDATTRRTLADTTMGLDRRELLSQIQALHERQSQRKSAATSSEAAPASAPPGDPATRSIVRDVQILMTGSVEVQLQLLSRRDLDARLTGFILPLLDQRHTARTALKALRIVGNHAVGQFVDALLDPRQPLALRRRVTRVLEECGSARARDGLWRGLGDERFEIRFSCGQALEHLIRQHPDLVPSKQRVFAAVQRELARPETRWSHPPASLSGISSTGDTSSSRTGSASTVSATSLQHALTLLGLVLDAEPLALCLTALGSGQPGLAGTALEYLEQVMPNSLYRVLEAKIGVAASESGRAPEKREQAAIVEDLHLSLSHLALDRAALLRHSQQTKG